MTSEVAVQEYLMHELLAETSANEVFLHCLCLNVSLENKLFLAVERDFERLDVCIILRDDACLPQLLPIRSTNFFLV